MMLSYLIDIFCGRPYEPVKSIESAPPAKKAPPARKKDYWEDRCDWTPERTANKAAYEAESDRLIAEAYSQDKAAALVERVNVDVEQTPSGSFLHGVRLEHIVRVTEDCQMAHDYFRYRTQHYDATYWDCPIKPHVGVPFGTIQLHLVSGEKIDVARSTYYGAETVRLAYERALKTGEGQTSAPALVVDLAT
jgi:hypothetical protein